MDSVTKDRSFGVSYMDLFEEWVKHAKPQRNTAPFTFVQSRQDLSGVVEQSVKEMKTVISRFSAKLSEKWESSRRTRDRFLTANAEWLEGNLTFNTLYELAQPSSSELPPPPPPGPGRPMIADLAATSSKTKRRRVDDLVKSRPVDELVVAAEISSRLSVSGKRTVAKLIREVSESPERVIDILKNSEQRTQQPRCLSRDEAVAYYVDSKSTTNGYKQARKWSMRAEHKVFPSLHSVRQAKEQCLPPKEHVEVTETRAEIKLQAVLDKTAQRLISAQREVIAACSPAAALCTKFLCIAWTLSSQL